MRMLSGLLPFAELRSIPKRPFTLGVGVPPDFAAFAGFPTIAAQRDRGDNSAGTGSVSKDPAR